MALSGCFQAFAVGRTICPCARRVGITCRVPGPLGIRGTTSKPSDTSRRPSARLAAVRFACGLGGLVAPLLLAAGRQGWSDTACGLDAAFPARLNAVPTADELPPLEPNGELPTASARRR
jgi:hypothetical protein